MTLADVPLSFVLIGLIAYTVLSGADFGAGLWQLAAGQGPAANELREHAHNAIAPVWEANHVWLIFVLTVLWTAYPTVFGSIASTLTIPLFIAAIGIICRGATYSLQAGVSSMTERRAIDTVFSLSCVLTPFALGTAVGGLASGRVPVGNAAGSLLGSWLNPTSILVGVLAVVLSAFLAAVYLAADARRAGMARLMRRFRVRALASGTIAGTTALGGLAVLRADAGRLSTGLLSGGGLPAVVLSGVTGLASLMLVWLGRFSLARYTAAAAVAAIVAGWAAAQRPVILPGLTIAAAAAGRDTLIALTVAVLAGAVLLFPSLALLFRLYLQGRFDPQFHAGTPRPTSKAGQVRPRLSTATWTRTAVACLVVGVGLLTVADTGWAHAIGVVALFGFVASGVGPIAPADLAAAELSDHVGVSKTDGPDGGRVATDAHPADTALADWGGATSPTDGSRHAASLSSSSTEPAQNAHGKQPEQRCAPADVVPVFMIERARVPARVRCRGVGLRSAGTATALAPPGHRWSLGRESEAVAEDSTTHHSAHYPATSVAAQGR